MHDRQRASGASLDPYPQSLLSVFRAAVPKSTPQGRTAEDCNKLLVARKFKRTSEHHILYGCTGFTACFSTPQLGGHEVALRP